MVYEALTPNQGSLDLGVTDSVIPTVTSIGTATAILPRPARTLSSSSEAPHSGSTELWHAADGSTAESLVLLPRKEVIQPHLPIRLPCYDLAPVIGFTFGAFLPCGLVRRLRVPPTPMA